MKKLLSYIIAYCGTLLVLMVLLIVSAGISNASIKQGISDSANYLAERKNFDRTDGNRIDSIQDNYADAILLNVLWHVDGSDAVKSVINTGYYDLDESNAVLSFKYAVDNNTPANVNYTRYWHGSMMWLRPLLKYTDIVGARNIVFGVICVLMVVVFVLLLYKHQYLAAVAFAASMTGIQFWKLSLALEYQPAFLVAMIMCIAYILLEKKGNHILIILSIVSGVMVAFVDFLTTELVTILLPLLIVMTIRVMDDRIRSFREEIKLLAGCFASWGISYVATFLAKWVIATVVTGVNQFGTAISSAGERVAGTGGDETLPLLQQIFAAPFTNLSTLYMGTIEGENRIDWGNLIVGIILTLIVLGSVYYVFRAHNSRKSYTLLCLVVGIIPLVRFIVLNNHSYLHVFFTYRTLCITIYALVAMIGANVSLKILRKKR